MTTLLGILAFLLFLQTKKGIIGETGIWDSIQIFGVSGVGLLLSFTKVYAYKLNTALLNLLIAINSDHVLRCLLASWTDPCDERGRRVCSDLVIRRLK